MAAGQGFKTFATGDVLTAADVNGYLMQGVLVFATTTARDAAITSPQQGQVALTKDTNTIWKYTGSTWTNIDTSGTMPLTTKGDIFGYDTAAARIPVGTNGQVLTADSAQALGVKWATNSAPATSWTLINSGGTSLSGSATTTVNVSGYDKYFAYVTGASTGSPGSDMYFRFNADSGSNYYAKALGYTSTFTWSNEETTGASWAYMGYTTTDGGTISASLLMDGANGSGIKTYQYMTDGSSQGRAYLGLGYWNNSNTVSSISFRAGINFDAGTLWVYGAN